MSGYLREKYATILGLLDDDDRKIVEEVHQQDIKAACEETYSTGQLWEKRRETASDWAVAVFLGIVIVGAIAGGSHFLKGCAEAEGERKSILIEECRSEAAALEKLCGERLGGGQ